jgi:prepilin-type N-terminal cleavage/methylation domain-containing protein
MHRSTRQHGFTLIEFMIAMGVVLVALTAAMFAFRDATNANRNVGARQDMADNLRAGMNLIQQDLLQAGTGIPTGGIPIPTFNGGGCTNPVFSNINRPMPVGTNKFPACNTYLPAVDPGNAMGPLITSPDSTTSPTNTDILTVLYQDNLSTQGAFRVGMDSAPINSAACAAGAITAVGDKATFDANCFSLATLAANGISINPGDLILFSNANGNAVQYVTSVSAQTLTFGTGDPFGFNQTGAPAGTLIQLQNTNCNTANPPVCTPNGTYPPTTATRIWMVSYYLDNLTDPAHVRLIRRVNFNGPTSAAGVMGSPVGETLENLQFTFNFNDGKTSNQATVPAGFTENQIRSVNLYLGTRSTSRASQTSQYLRENFQTQVTLRSMSYFNKYPGT